MNKIKAAACVLCMLSLTACLEGYQVVYTKDVMPYGNQRTAGTGVVYVRGGLMPPKSLSLKSETQDETLSQSFSLINDLPEQTLENAFLNRQTK